MTVTTVGYWSRILRLEPPPGADPSFGTELGSPSNIKANPPKLTASSQSTFADPQAATRAAARAGLNTVERCTVSDSRALAVSSRASPTSTGMSTPTCEAGASVPAGAARA